MFLFYTMNIINYYERVYAGHGEICECFYEAPKINGIHLAKNIGDRLPHEEDKPPYIAVFNSYVGVGCCQNSALTSLQNSPIKLFHADYKTYYAAAEQSPITNQFIKFWIKINTLLWNK